ncbi:hypothetical protein QFC19_009042 [Naganishia cerealis]|uniref:Uncharacterized protein n=1 Tax=Naganishia cerealis TaxID=610337 RepID=A0ACC2UYN4_9TREE|nr:hypothetical protein QFC19_009042 [Naganishia cerealis]
MQPAREIKQSSAKDDEFDIRKSCRRPSDSGRLFASAARVSRFRFSFKEEWMLIKKHPVVHTKDLYTWPDIRQPPIVHRLVRTLAPPPAVTMSVLTDSGSNQDIQAQSYVGFDSQSSPFMAFSFTKPTANLVFLGLLSYHEADRTQAAKAGIQIQRHGSCIDHDPCAVPFDSGQTGLGKSTMVNTLFASHLVDSRGRLDVDDPIPQTTAIEETQHSIVENGVRLKLNIIDTPGYGDQINNDGYQYADYSIHADLQIKDQYSGYLRKELTAQRDRHIADTRVHCCLFFINPTGHGLKPLDITVLRKLSEVVNVVPVIAKADSLTLEERELFKERIRAELQQHAIKLFPFDTEELDAEEIQLNERIRTMIPFAVIGSEKTVVIDGKPVRGRKTRWATINVEDERHCEFVYLRNFLTRTHLQDLIETTSLMHYEAFRAKQLTALKESSAKQQQQQQHQQATAL